MPHLVRRGSRSTQERRSGWWDQPSCPAVAGSPIEDLSDAPSASRSIPFQVDGSITVEILTDTDSHRVTLTAGQFVIVPKGHWHRHAEVHDVVEMFFTPGATVESTADDPRLSSSATAGA
jgi:hypothetical protein